MLKNYSKFEVDKFGNKRYLNDEGKPHRLDGSAVEYFGSKYWCINDKQHRNIDPSVEYSTGSRYWFFKGRQHRIGGSDSSTFETWFVYDKAYTKKEYYKKVWRL